MHEVFMRMVAAVRAVRDSFALIVPALQRMAEAANTRPWWTTAPSSVQFARVRQLGLAHPTRGPTLRCRLHRRRI